MEVSEPTAARLGLRERKKQQTRETIAQVALQLFAERGYDETTLVEIADAANISTRTIFAYFQSKEDILFCDEPVMFEELKRTLDQRPSGATTIDALRGFVGGMDPADRNLRLRKKIVGRNEELRLAERARFGRVEQLIADSITKDLDAGPSDIRPTLVAAAMTAAFMAAQDRLESESGEPLSHQQAMAILDEVLDFVRGGLDGLKGR